MAERLSPVSTEFPADSSEAKAMERFGGPILERPLAWHTTASDDLSVIINDTKQILSEGLWSGTKTGKSEHEDVYLELGRHHDSFSPTARSIPDPIEAETIIQETKRSLGVSLPYLPVKMVTEMGDMIFVDIINERAYAASFLVDMATPGMNHDPMGGVAKVSDRIPADFIWGVVFLHSSNRPVEPLEFGVSAKEVRQMRANARREITRRFKRLPETLADLWPLFAVDPDEKGQKLSDEVLADPQGFLESTVDEWLSLVRESKNPYEALVKLRKKRIEDKDGSLTESILGIVQHQIITGIFFHNFIGVLQEKERLGVAVKIPGSPSERFDEFFEVMRQVEHPVPIYGGDGALLWPVEMSHEEVRDYFLQRQGYRLP